MAAPVRAVNHPDPAPPTSQRIVGRRSRWSAEERVEGKTRGCGARHSPKRSVHWPVSAMKRKAPDSQEKACMLCRRADVSADVCGPKHEKRGLCVHENCLFSASWLHQRGSREEGICGFLPVDIKWKIKSAAQKGCFVCGERGAAISCQRKGCSRTFHLPCASEHGCVTQFFRPYRSFCWEHRPEQAVPARPTPETTCIICQEPVDEQLSYRTMVCPACKGAWFHRGCIQGQAVHAGVSCFQCPLCKNRRRFLPEMFKMGISIPFRGPLWEEGGRYRDLYQRHRRCDAARCLHPRGREQAEPSGRWELLLCSSCAAQGAHRGCSGLGNAAVSWECDECAGLGPASSAQPEPAAPSTSSQAEPAASSSSAAPRTRSPSGGTGPERRPSRSRLARRSQNPYRRP
ncbi:PHD finger protein 7-like [Rhea pennata]|uniref:PHD finger protein 7-like n=1 Tax=Rhea pennata TaxID=8795 RepID=UPI002E26CD26